MNFRKQFILGLTGLCCASLMQAQDTNTPALVTDRPDATEAPTVVPQGSLQVETGSLYTSFDGNAFKEEVFTYNTALLRYGLLDNFELRLGWNLEETRLSNNSTPFEVAQTSFSPLLLGMKVAIVEEKGWLPEIGLIGHIFLPFTVDKDLRPEFTSTDFRFAFNHTLSEKSGIAYNIGAQWGNDSPEIAYIYTFAYGYAITERLGAYVEVYGDFPEDNSANHFWDAGLTYAIAPLVQLDATIGQSITEGQDILLSAGISFRIDKKQ